MYLLPQPQSLSMGSDSFLICPSTPIVLSHLCSFEDLNAAIVLQEEIQSTLHFKLPIKKQLEITTKGIYFTYNKEITSTEGYTLTISKENIIISASTSTGIFYGVQTLRQIVRQNGAHVPSLHIEDAPHFPHRGFYHDATRGKVPTLETMKELVDRAAFYKINQLQLYVEHSFAFTGLSEVWFDKDPLTAEEILILDQYCQSRHVELVPSLSTFGHFYEILRSKTYRHLCELEVTDNDPYEFIGRQEHHTLNTLDEGSFTLVKQMLEEFIPLFSSPTFNICCDETFDLGKGKSKSVADEIGTGKLYVDFLNRIVNVVKSHDKSVMFWGDVILHHPELLSEIPQDVSCLTWDYAPTGTDTNVATIAATGLPQYVCPGVGGWNMMMNLMHNAFSNIHRMAMYGKTHKAVGLLNTDWGDYGHINHLGNSMPGMIFGAHVSWNAQEDIDFTEVYRAISHIEYGDTSETLVSLLNELSACQPCGWADMIRFKERNDLPNFDCTKITEAYYASAKIAQQLAVLSPSVRYNTFDTQEFITSARGLQLINAVMMTLMKYERKLPEATLLLEPKELAVALEIWFTEFASNWRKRNKESELYRVRESITWFANYLRDLK